MGTQIVCPVIAGLIFKITLEIMLGPNEQIKSQTSNNITFWK